ncbi:MAG: rod shape-determining protein RodA [Calditrichia bacterium]
MTGRRFKNIDFVLLGSVAGLLLLGLVALYSTSQPHLISAQASNYFSLQLGWIGLGSIVIMITTFLPSRFFYTYAYFFYAIAFLLLILVFFIGTTGKGATRWIYIAGIGFQPSEFAKIAVLLALGRFLTENRSDINHLMTFLTALAIVLVPMVMIMRQPDLGTSLVLMVLILPIFYWAGLDTKKLFFIITPVITILASFNFYVFFVVMLLIIAGLYLLRPPVHQAVLSFAGNIGFGLLTPLLWNQLKDYQKSRILVFWNPESDPLGAGYQIIQSKVAIGSGGFFGKGFLNGSQTQLRFLPEQHTDFIYAVIAEELGFIGVFAGLFLFTLFLLRTVHLADQFKNKFSSLIAIGIGTILAFHMFVNIGMTIGLFPVTGLPLPFISYGGTALLTNMLMVGLLLNFYRHRYEY